MAKTRNHWLIVTALFAILAAVILAGCSSTLTSSRPQAAIEPVNPQSSKQAGGLVQYNSGGSATIEATLLGHQNDALAFEISMNTHSVNLDGYDLKQLAVLHVDEDKEYSPVEWSSAPGGHHRSGKLVFSHPDQSGKTLKLVIHDVAGVKERVLMWQA